MPADADRRRETDAPAGAVRLDEELRQAQADLARALAENAHLKAEFLQAQKMEVVGRLASGVAHDFKNVLTLIAGYADLLIKRAEAGETREPLLEIRSACQRAIGLAEQLLTYGRKEAARQSPISFNTILSDSGRMLRRMLPADVDLTIRQDPGLGLVLANAGQMYQVLLNLVVNARDAMPSGGRLVIEVGNVDVAAGSAEAAAGARAGRHVRLSVVDSGVGMDDETRRRALEPFFTTKEGKTGTGLGLSTVHAIVTECRGHIVLESAPGAGTKVLVYLPRVDADADASEGDAGLAGPGEPQATAQRPRRILVVDDDESVRRLLVDLLGGAGYAITATADPTEHAVPAGEEEVFDLAVVDLATLEQAAGSTSSLVQGRRLKTVGLSGGAPWHPAASMSRFEVGATVTKPIVPRQLLRAVRDMLEAN
jgi:signal transduction histidine kinase